MAAPRVPGKTLPFWQTKSLDEMTRDEWESLCDGCGRCCLHKLRDDDTEELSFTNVACRLLDLGTCQCSDYEHRRDHVPDCVSLTPALVREIDWLPPSCAYRLVADGRDLFPWHPLISGDPATVHAAGISVLGRALDEREAGNLENYIVAWPGRMPRAKHPRKKGPQNLMQNALYGGVNVAVLTAMRPDLTVDLDRMATHSNWLLAQGVDGLGVLGTTGEANSLGVSERIHLIEGLVERGLPAAKMLPGVGLPAIPDTVAMARRAAELGCRGALVLPPFFYKNPSEDGLFAYYSEIIQRLGGALKLYFYHFPAQSAVPITVSLIERVLRAYPGAVNGIKDSTGDWSNTKSYIDHFAADGFEVYCGDDSHLLQNLQAGGAGSISAASNVSAATNAAVYANWDNPKGADAQHALTAMRGAVTSAPLIPGLKALVARHTGDADWENIRPPHTALTAEQKAKLFSTFDACGINLAKAA